MKCSKGLLTAIPLLFVLCAIGQNTDTAAPADTTIRSGRSTLEKQYDGFLKYRLLWQSAGKNKMPLSLTLLSSVTLTTDKNVLNDSTLTIKDKLGYAYQVLIARKFSSAFSFQVMP